MEWLPQGSALSKLAGQGAGGGFMGLSGWGLLAGLVFSSIGLYYIKQGKTGGDSFTLFTGLALLGSTCFVTNALYMTLIGLGLVSYRYYHNKYE